VHVALGRTVEGSIAAPVCALVERGVLLRPEVAERLEASVVLRFTEGFPSVRIDFRGDEIEVTDDPDFDMAHDLAIEGSLPDIVALTAAPLAGGLPKPTAAAGRAAIARLADGRVDFDGRLRLARDVLRLLSVAPERRVASGG
jgi:hypothetical protein